MTPERLDGIRQHVAKVGRCPACWTNIPDLLAHVDALTAERDVLRAALPDPSKLWALAEWIDLRYPNDSNPEVQNDLRAWARQIMAVGTQYRGVTEKEVLEPQPGGSTGAEGEG